MNEVLPYITVNDLSIYYEMIGEGPPLIFIHGGFVNSSMWTPQVDFFSKDFQVIIYDVRGHGKTSGSIQKKYHIETFAEDLYNFLEALQITQPILCGLSLGGMIAQNYATRYPNDLRALILADTAVSTTLTFWDKLMVYLLAPKWLMLLFLRLFGVKRFIKFSFWFARFSRGKKWLGDETIITYEKEEMLKVDKKEYLKIFSALYDFRLQELSKISVPTLVLSGVYESKSVLKHADFLNRHIETSSLLIIHDAGHITNLENAKAFNQAVESFLIHQMKQ